MILEYIISLLISCLPDFSIDIDLLDYFSTILSYVALVNHYISLESFVIAAGVVLYVWTVCAFPSLVIELL